MTLSPMATCDRARRESEEVEVGWVGKERLGRGDGLQVHTS